MHLYKEHKRYLKLQEINQKSCKHDFKTNVSLLIEDDGRKFWTTYDESVIHCKKCHFTTYEKYRNR
jgi:hypothetical protein